MGKLFGWIPRIVRTAVGTIAVGFLVGYMSSAAVSAMIADRGWFAFSGESPEARAYMLAFVQGDTESATALRARRRDVVKGALGQPCQTEMQQLKPLTLTYLGGSTQGPVSVQVYVVEARTPDGSQGLLTCSMTLVRGKVYDIR